MKSARVGAGVLIVSAAIAAAVVWAPMSAPASTTPAVSAETSGSVGATGSADTTGSTTTTPSAPATPTVKPKPKDKRPKAPWFMPKKGKAIYIDRKHQRIYLYVDGRQIDKFKCSTSRTLPRRGTYHMKRRRLASSSFNGAVTFRYQTIFAVGPHGHNIAFHSIPVNSAGHEIAPVGQPVSHGCVRVKFAKAKFIYYWITKKTPIVVRP